ncbi:ARF GTPase-activating protein GIT2-like [Tropilaelaps mercedesae]|uniref:ARF GTPase-activating protein GIT2-like n=1 Tax=Tropilaelaps mercedesae TaxID=418985 RepID=A0A1V9XBS4_9ACAR|nr:ARF GTPase-activating protein GIT2-like [Tropilaelaps mercedesae]
MCKCAGRTRRKAVTLLAYPACLTTRACPRNRQQNKSEENRHKMSSGGGVKLADLCADCCAADPSWASLSLGVLICSRCALVHFGLGRHVSHIVCVNDRLPVRQKELLDALSTRNINSVWEHYLLDSSFTGGYRKPSPNDQSLHPTRSAFIKSKYVFMNFMERLPHDVNELQVNIRLMTNLRTNDVDESLKLILQGADVRFVHHDTGQTLLHAAVLAGQPLQVELLLIHGADPRAEDTAGHSALDLARAACRPDLTSQMMSALNQLSDRLQSFVASIDGQLLTNTSPPLQLDDEVRTELCKDLYDEVERRELQELMNCDEVPFLPVNPAFASVRNQSRQKLARLSRQELATLIVMCVGQERLRETNSCDGVGSGSRILDDDDEPLYDSVCGDDDITIIAEEIEQSATASIIETPESPTTSPPSPAPALPAAPPPVIEAPGFFPNLILKTDEITKRTHALLMAAKTQNESSYLSICKQIRCSVVEMSYLLPQSFAEPACHSALQDIIRAADDLVDNCDCLLTGDKAENAQNIIKLVFNVAHGVKTFVTSFPHLRNKQPPSLGQT